MSEFEVKSLAQQRHTTEMLERTLKEQRDFQSKVETAKQVEGLAKSKSSYEKVLQGCSQLVVDVNAIDDLDNWKAKEDDAIRKAMGSKAVWLKKAHDMQEEFLRYKTLMATWQPEALEDEESEYSQLKDHFELAKKAVEEAIGLCRKRQALAQRAFQ